MFTAFFKGIAQLEDAATRRVLWISIGFSVLAFVTLWSAVATLLSKTAFFDIMWLESIIDFLGGFATLMLTWFLFPGVTSSIIGLYLDRVVETVENQHYPQLVPIQEKPFSETLLPTIKFIAIMIVLNIFILLFLIIPPLFPFVFYSVNGYLIGREYFELVALRRLNAKQARNLRKQHGAALYLLGALAAFLLTIPIVNLFIPVIIISAIVHLFHKWHLPIISTLDKDINHPATVQAPLS